MRSVAWILATLAAGCGGGSAGSPDGGAPDVAIDTSIDAPHQPIEFDCQADASCPPLAIAGDPISTSSFRGYGDPSLEKDPTGALWLSYSWLEIEQLSGNPSQLHAVMTHLAKSTDAGATFSFVRAINAAVPAPNNAALVMHEVSTLARTDAGWEDLWLTYALIPPQESNARVQFHYQHTTASSPEGLGDNASAYLKGTAGDIPTELAGASIAGLENCLVFTEPALFAHGGETYLATTCIVNPGDPTTQRLVLLRRSGATLVLVGELLSSADAQELGGTRVEQIDLSIARDDAIIAIVTPILDGSPQPHRGCVVLEIDDLAHAHVRREADGSLYRRAVITGSTAGIGPGLCTYDRDSDTGILIDLTITSPVLAFDLRKTGIHP